MNERERAGISLGRFFFALVLFSPILFYYDENFIEFSNDDDNIGEWVEFREWKFSISSTSAGEQLEDGMSGDERLGWWWTESGLEWKYDNSINHIRIKYKIDQFS